MEQSPVFSDTTTPEVLYYTCLTIDRNTASPCHSHTFYEFTFLYGARGHYVIDGAQFEVRKGDILLFRPGVRHGERMEGEDRWDMLVIAFEGFDFSAVPGLFDTAGRGGAFLRLGQSSTAIIKCCEEIREELQCCRVGCRQMVKSLIDRLFVLLIRSGSGIPTVQSVDARRVFTGSFEPRAYIKKVKEFLEFYYSSSISIENIAHNAYMSQAYLIRLFKEETGETPNSYLIRTRIGKAAELLGAGDRSIEEISRLVGYEDTVHFSKLFKKHMGVSPTAYRNATRGRQAVRKKELVPALFSHSPALPYCQIFH